MMCMSLACHASISNTLAAPGMLMPGGAAYSAESSAYSGASTNTPTGAPNHELWETRIQGQQGRGEGGRRVRGAEVVLGGGECGGGSGLQSLCSVDTDESQDENGDGGAWDRGDRAEGEGIASGGIRFRGGGGDRGGGVGIEREWKKGGRTQGEQMPSGGIRGGRGERDDVGDGERFTGEGGGGGTGAERGLLGHMTTEHNAWLVRQLLLPSISRLLAE
jgi:hypothetical protein